MTPAISAQRLTKQSAVALAAICVGLNFQTDVISMPIQPNQSGRLQATRAVFEPRAKRPLSDEDCREITKNVIGFFTILAEWDAAERTHNENHEARTGRAS